MDDIWARLVVGAALGLLAFIATEIHEIRKMLAWRNERLSDKL